MARRRRVRAGAGEPAKLKRAQTPDGERASEGASRAQTARRERGAANWEERDPARDSRLVTTAQAVRGARGGKDRDASGVCHAGAHVLCRVVALAETGLGVGDAGARFGAREVCVEDGLPGETGDAKLLHAGRHAVTLRLVARTSAPSPARREPPLPCPRWTPASPCRVMHLTEPAQLAFKQERVAATWRAAGLDAARVEPTRAAVAALGWRTRASYVVAGRRGALRLGGYRRGTHIVQDMLGCPIEDGAVQHTARAVLATLDAFGVEPADPELPLADDAGCGAPLGASEPTRRVSAGHSPARLEEDGLRYVVVRAAADGTTEVTLLTPSGSLPNADALAAELCRRDQRVVGVCLGAAGPGDRLFADAPPRALAGAHPLVEERSGLRFALSPAAFFQVNPATAAELQDAAVALAEAEALAQGHAAPLSVLELYSGVGALALRFAARGHRVTGVEVSESATRDAARNAALNGLPTATFLHAAAEGAVEQLLASGRLDAVVVNPPRKGLAPSAAQALAARGPALVVYVSCNPVTLARDVAVLEAAGYETRRVLPWDLFPQSEHVETVAVLARPTARRNAR